MPWEVKDKLFSYAILCMQVSTPVSACFNILLNTILCECGSRKILKFMERVMFPSVNFFGCEVTLLLLWSLSAA